MPHEEILSVHPNRNAPELRERLTAIFNRISALAYEELLLPTTKCQILIKYAGINCRLLLGTGQYVVACPSFHRNIRDLLLRLPQYNSLHYSLDIKLLLTHPFSKQAHDYMIAELDWKRTTVDDTGLRNDWEPSPQLVVCSTSRLEYLFPARDDPGTRRKSTIFFREACDTLDNISALYKLAYPSTIPKQPPHESRDKARTANGGRFPIQVRYSLTVPQSSLLLIQIRPALEDIPDLVLLEPYHFGKRTPGQECLSGQTAVLHGGPGPSFDLWKNHWRYLWEQDHSILFEDATIQQRGRTRFLLPPRIHFRQKYECIERHVAPKKGFAQAPTLACYEAQCRRALMGRIIEFGQPSLADPGTALSIAEEILKTGQGVDVWFQPIVNLQSQEAIGYEALSVLVHRNTIIEGMGQFYRFLQEDVDLCVAFEMLLLKIAACRFEEAHQNGGTENLHRVKQNPLLFVNVSPATLLSGRPVRFLQNSSIDIHRVVIEIIEHFEYAKKKDIGDYLRSISKCAGLAKLRFALDDAFDGDSMKILGEIGTLDALAFLKTNTQKPAFLKLLEGIKKRIIVEGISDRTRARAALKQGFSLGQGWLFGKKSPRLASPLKLPCRNIRRKEG